MSDNAALVWTPRAIAAECGRAHRQYKRALEETYTAYFEDHPELGSSHAWKARDLAAALPEGWAHLGDLIPRQAWHIHHLSGGSSQVLAVALLGSAIETDPSLGWLRDLLELPRPFGSPKPRTTFEFALTPETLGESPRVTSVDLLIDDPGTLICIEAKFWEAGVGSCSCGKDTSPERAETTLDLQALDRDAMTPAQERAACSEQVLSRTRYWTTARDVLGLPLRVEGRSCPIAASYQAVRNLAAARALAGERIAVFALFFDERNPYFAGSGVWPGWPAELDSHVVDGKGVRFRPCSWQRLLASGAVPSDVVDWAREKHGLGA